MIAPPEGFCSVAYSFGTFDDVDGVRAGQVDLGRMSLAPLLSCLLDSVVNDHESATMHAVDDRLSCRCARAYAAHSAHALQQVRERTTSLLLNLYRTDLHDGTVRDGSPPSRHDYSGAELDARLCQCDDVLPLSLRE